MDSRDKDREKDLNRTRKIPKPVEREGVIYTPSSYDEDEDMSHTRVIRPVSDKNKPPLKRVPSQTAKKLPPKKSKSNYAIFLVTTVFVGVLICVFVFAIVFNTVINKDDGGGAAKVTPGPAATSPAIAQTAEPLADGQVIGLIKAINQDAKKLELFIMDTCETKAFYAEGATDMKDKFGKAMAFQEFRVGDIIEVTHPAESQNMTVARVSSQGISYKGFSDVSVDATAKTLSIGNAKIAYDENTICLYNNTAYNIEDIDVVDIVTVNTYKDKVMFVSISKSHGFLTVKENKDIINGEIEVDTSTYSLLEAFDTLKVTEGDHRIVVKGSNIEPFMQDVTIASGESHEIALDGVVMKAGFLSVKVDVEGARLTVNGEVRTPNEAIVLDYGTYTIKVEKQDYTTFEKEVVFDTPQLEVTAVLEQIVKVSNVTVSSEPGEAKVYIDGTYIGPSPIRVPVEYGKHTITVTKEGYMDSPPIDVYVNTEDLPLNIILLLETQVIMD